MNNSVSKHPYPQHVVEAVRDAIIPWIGPGVAAKVAVQTALQALWDASRVDDLGQLKDLPSDAVIYGQDYWLGFTSDAKFELINSDLPAHVLHWGDPS